MSGTNEGKGRTHSKGMRNAAALLLAIPLVTIGCATAVFDRTQQIEE
jgi:hypothetical protein